MKMAAALTLTVSAVAFINGCGQSTTVSDPNQIVFPDTLVSYRNHVQPFIALRCGPCHGDNIAAGGVRLTSYSYLLFDRPNLIVPNKPSESRVIQVLELTSAHPSGNIDQIPWEQVQGMRRWVFEGAPSN